MRYPSPTPFRNSSIGNLLLRIAAFAAIVYVSVNCQLCSDAIASSLTEEIDYQSVFHKYDCLVRKDHTQSDEDEILNMQIRANKRNIIYRNLETSLKLGSNIESAIKNLVISLSFETTNMMPKGTNSIEGSLSIPNSIVVCDNFLLVSRLADLAVASDQARSVLENVSSPELLYIISIIILDELNENGRDTKVAKELIELAARRGLGIAQFHFGFLSEQGMNSTPDIDGAIRWYKEAAKSSQPAGAFALARVYDDGIGVPQDLKEASNWYQETFRLIRESAQDDMPYAPAIAETIQTRIAEGSDFFSSSVGQGAIKKLVKEHPEIGTALGNFYSCTDCGGVVDARAAADWYRSASASLAADDAHKFAKLLRLFPETNKFRGEHNKVLANNAQIQNYDSSKLDIIIADLKDKTKNNLGLFNSRLKSSVINLCRSHNSSLRSDKDSKSPSKSSNSDCPELAYAMALGLHGAEAITVGYNWLVGQYKSEELHSGAELADVLAFYGAFKESLEIYRKNKISIYSGNNAKMLTIKRLVSKRYLNIEETAIAEKDLTFKGNFELGALKELLDYLAARGDEEAKSYAFLLSDIKHQNNTTERTITLTESQDQYESQLARGISIGLVNAARSVSDSLRLANENARALDYELVALGVELKLDIFSTLVSGEIASQLSSICHMTKSSGRVAELGYKDLSVALAKNAVNRLQKIRRSISNLPENIQACFRNTASSYYRALIDVLIDRGRTREAQATLSMLHDFEKFEYFGKKSEDIGSSFDLLPTEKYEKEIDAWLMVLSQPSLLPAQRRARLRRKQALGTLTGRERIEADRLSKEASKIAEKRTKDVQMMLAALVPTGRSDQEREVRRTKELLQKEGILQNILRRPGEKIAGMAALHYVVLPNRLHVILTTANEQKVVTVNSIDGNHFSEVELNKKIQRLREAVSDTMEDPSEASRDLFEILVSPIIPMLGSVDGLLISPDRQLSYIPFAALKSRDYYLAEKFKIVTITDDQFPVPIASFGGTELRALGVSEATGGYSALPNAYMELISAVEAVYGAKAENSESKIFLNQKFDRENLSRSLIFPNEVRGIIHVASHFFLTPDDKTSVLLLGKGAPLSLAEIKSNRDKFSFRDVSLLVLSACETAYTQRSDGSSLRATFSELAGREGARTVIGTLWPVNDSATAQFFSRLYKEAFGQKLPFINAVSNVQREFINSKGRNKSVDTSVNRDLSHPYYWAPFVMMGSWN